MKSPQRPTRNRPTFGSGLVAVAAAAVLVAAVSVSTAEQRADVPPRPYRVNVNAADPATLELLPLIGAKTADRMVLHRQAHGPFASPERLRAVKGIGEQTAAAVAPWVEFGAAAAPDATTPPVR